MLVVVGEKQDSQRCRTGAMWTCENPIQADFHEKAHSVKADVAAAVAECNGSLPFALCFHPHFR